MTTPTAPHTAPRSRCPQVHANTGTTLTPVNGRDPYAGRRVAVYKNLHRDTWSVRGVDGPHRGTVVAHAKAVALTDAHMHVNTRAQARIADGAPREVHAWITGVLVERVDLPTPVRITYRPHVRPEFFIADTGQTIRHAAAVLLTGAAYINDQPHQSVSYPEASRHPDRVTT